MYDEINFMDDHALILFVGSSGPFGPRRMARALADFSSLCE